MMSRYCVKYLPTTLLVMLPVLSKRAISALYPNKLLTSALVCLSNNIPAVSGQF